MSVASPDPEFDRLLERANTVFKEWRLNPNSRFWMHGFDDFTAEIEYFLVGRTWKDIISVDAFKIPLEYAPAFDLVELPFAMSQEWLSYFLPGFLLHFIRAGTYEPTNFYYKFISRLQPDNDYVIEFGGPEIYFPLNSEQKQFCCDALRLLKVCYGFPYERSNTSGYEHLLWQDVSISRAIDLYWH